MDEMVDQMHSVLLIKHQYVEQQVDKHILILQVDEEQHVHNEPNKIILNILITDHGTV